MIAIKAVLTKIISVVMSILMLIGIDTSFIRKPNSEWKTNYKYVMVHGLMGWGSYDAPIKSHPTGVCFRAT